MEPEKKLFICDRCKKEITDIAVVEVRPAIILQKYLAQIPPIFKCPEHAENYTKPMRFHADCWMDELRDHGVEINNMTEVIKKYLEEANAKAVIEGDK
jgi:hypothetical protein